MDSIESEVPTLLEQNRILAQKLHTAERQIGALEHRLTQLLRRLYGPRSERIDPQQLSFAFEELEGVPAAVEAIRHEARETPAAEVLEAPDAEEPDPPAAPRKPGAHGRTPLPKDLPRIRVVHDPSLEARTCAGCSSPMRRIGEEVTEELDYIPASTIVREHVRGKYACPKCAEGVVTLRLPARPIDQGRPGTGLLAHIAVSKYADHLPLYRQSLIFARQGLDLSRSTLCGWIAATAGLLEPLVLEMRRSILQSPVIHSDDTPITVLDRSHPKGRRRGFLWVYVGDRDEAVYDFTPSRSRDGPLRFLGDWKGFLQADAYAGYDEIFRTGRVVEIGCWAHARRKFVEAMDTAPAESSWVLAHIQRLYRIETEAAERGLGPEGRAALRHTQARPVLESLATFLEAQESQALPRSALGEAIRYVRKLGPALLRYVEDGRLAIDNNVAERALRRIAVGRNNWLFAGSAEGGKRAAILYSLIETCRLQGIEPFEYLRDALDRVSTHPASRVAELTPRGWKAARDRAAVSAQAARR